MKYTYVMRSTRYVDDDNPGQFSDPSLLVLASLAEGPKHGHAMVEDIYRLSGSRLGAGTLYGAIGRLEERGLIEPLRMEDRRRPYRLTAEGEEVLRARLTVLGRLSVTGLRRLEAL